MSYKGLELMDSKLRGIVGDIFLNKVSPEEGRKRLRRLFAIALTVPEMPLKLSKKELAVGKRVAKMISR